MGEKYGWGEGERDFWTDVWMRMNFCSGSMPVKMSNFGQPVHTAMIITNFVENTLKECGALR